MSIERYAQDIIKQLLIAFWYNRNIKYMKALCEEIKNRLANKDCDHTDDGDILYGFIILMFGEFGTSPRSGWLLEIKPETVIDTIIKFESEFIRGLDDE